MLREAVWTVAFVLGLAVSGLAGEPAKAPDELPTRVIKVLRTTDKAQTNSYVPKVYAVENVNPYELLRWIRRTAQIEEGGFYFFGKPDKDGNVKSGKILVYAPPSKVDDVTAWLPKIDVPPPQVMVEVAVHEIYVDNEPRLGLDYVAWKNDPGRNLFAMGAFSEKEKVFTQDNFSPLLNTGTGILPVCTPRMGVRRTAKMAVPQSVQTSAVEVGVFLHLAEVSRPPLKARPSAEGEANNPELCAGLIPWRINQFPALLAATNASRRMIPAKT